MRFIRFLLPLLVSILLTFSACTGSDAGQELEPNTIAEIGDDFTIQFARLNAFHSNNEFGARFPDSELSGYKEALDLLITNRLKHVDFYESGMHLDSANALELQRLASDELINTYFEKQHLGNYINENSIREYYDGMQQVFHYRRIVLNKTQSGGQQERVQINNTIDDILKAADGGESFESLINIYSREASDSEAAGTVRTVQWNSDTGNQMFNQVYTLDEGDIKVLETSSSFLIIRIDRTGTRQFPPLQQVRSEIDRNLRILYYNRSQEEFEEEKERLIDQNSFDWNQQGLEQLADWSSIPGFYDGEYRDTLTSRLEANDNFTIATYAKGEVDAEEYLRLLNNVFIMDSSGSEDIEEHKKFITEALKRDKIIDKANEMGLNQNILNPNHSNVTLRNRAIQLYNEKHIDSKIPEPDQQDLGRFYESHKDTLYYQLPRVRIFAHVYDDSSKAIEALNRYENGARFEDLEPSYLVRSFQKNRDGDIESYIRRGEPYLGEAAFGLSLNKVAGPISFDHAENGKQFAVIKLTNIVPEKQLSYSEVEDRIVSDYKDFHRKRIVQSVKDDLWSRYPVTIYKDKLRQRISTLQ